MKRYAVEANVDPRLKVDDDVYEKFGENISKRIKTRVPKFIRDEFKENILSYKYGTGFGRIFLLTSFDYETLRAVRKYKSKN
jgi:hypothetical protein